jgi:hypothetical protein
MRKYLPGAALIVLAVLASPARMAAKTETIAGKVIDLYCYSRDNKATGMDHRDGKECALACVKWEGQPVGLLTADGKVYQLAGDLVAHNNAKVVPHLTHTVTVTGDVVDRDGIMTITASDLTMVKK